MGEIRVRNLDEGLIAAFADMARRHGRSLAEEARDIIADAVNRPRREMLERLDRLHADILADGRPLPDSTLLIREERDRS